MTSFDDREKAFEKRYAHEQEVDFRINARRMKLVGLWAATQFGKTGASAEAYAKEVILADFEKPGPDDVIEKLATDFRAAGLAIMEKDIRAEMERQLAVARQQIEAERASA